MANSHKMNGPLFMVIGDKFLDDMPQVFLVQHDEVVEALLPKGLREPLGIGVLYSSCICFVPPPTTDS